MAGAARISYALPDAADAVGLSERTLRDAIAEGSLIAHYQGRKPLVMHRDLEAWVESLPTERRAAS